MLQLASFHSPILKQFMNMHSGQQKPNLRCKRQSLTVCRKYVLLQTQSASKQMVDLENKPETSTDDEKKEQTFGLRTDQYAKKGLQVVTLDRRYKILWNRFALCNII